MHDQGKLKGFVNISLDTQAFGLIVYSWRKTLILQGGLPWPTRKTNTPGHLPG